MLHNFETLEKVILSSSGLIEAASADDVQHFCFTEESAETLLNFKSIIKVPV